MKTKTKIILLAFATFAVMVAYMYLRINGVELVGEGIGRNLSIIVATLTPLAIKISKEQAGYTVQKVVSYVSSDNRAYDKKRQYCNMYVTKEFMESDKYRSILNLGSCSIREISVRKENNRRCVFVALSDGRDVEFEVVRKTKHNSMSSKNDSAWIINDFKQIRSRKV